MGLAHSPRIVTDGLVLALDAGNSKSYNAGISTNWTDKVGGNNGTLVGGTHHNDGPFVGAGYVEFDGSGDYIDVDASSPDFELGSDDFTIETWVLFNSNSPDDGCIISKHTISIPHWVELRLGSTQGAILTQVSFDGTSWGMSYQSNNLVTTNVWYHIALVRSGSVFTTYINGVANGTASSASSISNNTSYPLRLGARGNADQPLDGYISNLRILKGTALYTSDFTPPSSPLTAVTNTKLLTCQGNSISDASSSGHTITVNGDATANLGFPASAFEFDGSNDYVTLSSSQIAPGTGAFTWNFWAKHIPTGGGVGRYSILLSGTGSNSVYGVVTMNSDTGLGYYANGLRIIDSNPSFNDEWWHIAFVGNGGLSGARTLKLYRNGVQAGSTYTYDYNFTSTTPIIGANHSSFAELMRGNISNVFYYNKALTEAEVQQNYNALRGRYGI